MKKILDYIKNFLKRECNHRFNQKDVIRSVFNDGFIAKCVYCGYELPEDDD